ncbi:rhamnose utilization protein RhaD (predicted bifunctional aldolase and dehydrogenase) [Mycetocola sp. CAN_C7]|uniref:class II aldolase/adducin family protein n=1 Tax=Mycetocola sp. CAN_C7 TaxID=2787724 RepID=UPI0018CBDFB3
MPPKYPALVELARALGDSSLDLVVLAEGNVSERTGESTFAVKASGRSMANADERDMVELSMDPLLALLDDASADDATVAAALAEAKMKPDAPMPSVETLLHLVCQQLDNVRFVAHTHPVDVNALLCSVQPTALVDGTLFPDQVVVLGSHQLLVPYADPGLPLARIARQLIKDHVATHRTNPKVIYLQNHGMFALGQSANEAFNITVMARKVARVTLGTLAAGGPAYLSDHAAERIDSREDEVARRAELLRARL